MIKVRYRGRLGNRMFQYCLGRILAQGLGYRLIAQPIDGFPGTAVEVPGADYSDQERIVLSGHKIDLAGILASKPKNKIVLRGYFERYEYYRAHRDAIRLDWLRMDPDHTAPPDPDAVVVHVRRTDKVSGGDALPFSFYERAIEEARGRSLFLCTDDPKDPFIARFQRFGARLFHDSPLVDMRFMLSFNKIILSCSTYSWWAGFLSDASEIYFPRPTTGRWDPRTHGIDLVVTDDDRYRYLDVGDAYRGNLRERIYNIRWDLRPLRRALNRMRRARGRTSRATPSDPR